MVFSSDETAFAAARFLEETPIFLALRAMLGQFARYARCGDALRAIFLNVG